MRRISFILGLWVLLSAQVDLQFGFPSGTFQDRGPLDAGASFTGPGDIVSGAVAWWGLRAYSVADKGNRLINVCNVADAACADLSSDATTGALVITTIGGLSCAVVTCTIKTFYDRSGGLNCDTGATACDLTQATISARPTLVVNCIGSLPCAACDAASSQGVTSAFPFHSHYTQPNTVSYVANRTGGTTSYSMVYALDGARIQVGFNNSTNTLFAYSGAIGTATASDNSFHAVQNILNGASSNIYVDGSANTVSVGTDDSDGTKATICMPGANKLTGKFTEVGFWNVGFDGTQQANMNANQHSYWGF